MAKGQRVVIPASLVQTIEGIQTRELLDTFGEAVSWIIRDWVKCRTDCPGHATQSNQQPISTKGIDLDSVLDELA
jgi:hypothetical protein